MAARIVPTRLCNPQLMPTELFKHLITTTNESPLDVLARISTLPKLRIKDAMAKGAVWLKRGSKNKRVRRSTYALSIGDELSLYYNPQVLALTPPQPQLLADEKHYSIWLKPAGLLAQGSQEGDHCALLRIVELQLKREVFLVHRLDREAAGLMLIAHTSKAAAALSALFAAEESLTKIKKIYQVEVLGHLPEHGEITLSIDSKNAVSRYSRLHYDTLTNHSSATVQLITGRKHQIRRHFADSGFPVLGDPQYGSNNKDPRGLQLFAVELAFTCPLTELDRRYCWQR